MWSMLMYEISFGWVHYVALEGENAKFSPIFNFSIMWWPTNDAEAELNADTRRHSVYPMISKSFLYSNAFIRLSSDINIVSIFKRLYDKIIRTNSVIQKCDRITNKKIRKLKNTKVFRLSLVAHSLSLTKLGMYQ